MCPLLAQHTRELFRFLGNGVPSSSGLSAEKDIIGRRQATHGLGLGANSAPFVFVEESLFERTEKQ